MASTFIHKIFPTSTFRLLDRACGSSERFNDLSHKPWVCMMLHIQIGIYIYWCNITLKQIIDNILEVIKFYYYLFYVDFILAIKNSDKFFYGQIYLYTHLL